ncbi:hypothetical protein ACRAWF_11940 [Streptomyces sp. L7]
MFQMLSAIPSSGAWTCATAAWPSQSVSQTRMTSPSLKNCTHADCGPELHIFGPSALAKDEVLVTKTSASAAPSTARTEQNFFTCPPRMGSVHYIEHPIE